jgi:peptidoglycan/LPS O-acetylase OafA/YrhL
MPEGFGTTDRPALNQRSRADFHQVSLTTPSSDRYRDIQVLRAIACVIVIVQHLDVTICLFDMLPVRATMPFYLGVELFFVWWGVAFVEPGLSSAHLVAYGIVRAVLIVAAAPRAPDEST